MNVLRIFMAFLLLLKHGFSMSNTCPKDCQNDGICVAQSDSYGCICPCDYTGDTCQLENWCPGSKFSKVGCLTLTATKKALFSYPDLFDSATADDWNKHLDNVTCSCALAARAAGLKYFSLGVTWCVGFSETEVPVENKSPVAGCRGKDKSDCDDNSTLVACIGSSGSDPVPPPMNDGSPSGGSGIQYVYELSLADQLNCEKEYRSCADYDYFVRFHDSPTEMYFGPIDNAFPAGQSFSFCVWIKAGWDSVTYATHHVYYIFTVSVSNNADHFGLGLESSDGLDGDSFVIRYGYDKKSWLISYNYPGGIFHKWIHLCVIYDMDTHTAATYLNGTVLDSLTSTTYFKPLRKNGKLIIGRDQDKYWGKFGDSDLYFGDMTLFNVWDYLLSAEDVAQIFTGPGTEQGNHLAWVDLKKYLHGVTPFRDSPIMKWSGGGCRWERRECEGQSGICKGGIFRCPCSDQLTAPRSCVNSDVSEIKPCSEHNYFLEFPSTHSRVRMHLRNVLHRTLRLSVCLWVKFPPGSNNYHSLVYIGHSIWTNFHFHLGSDQKAFRIYQKVAGHVVWQMSETYNDNQWFHTCAIQDYKTFKMYKGGTSLGDKTISKVDPTYGHSQIFIGDTPTQSNDQWSFIGSMAHINIWDKVLNDATIADMAARGGTYVGNLVRWPDFQREYVVSGISVRRPSPVMKWSGPNCHWSKDSCSVGQLCDDAEYVCPSLQMNGVYPHSCGVSSSNEPVTTETSQDYGWKPHPALDLLLVSRDMNTVQLLGVLYSSIFVNEFEHQLHGAEMFFIILDALTGSFVKTFSCRTLSDATCDTKITDELNKVSIERIIAMVVLDSAGPHYGAAIPAMYSSFGEELYITNTLVVKQPFSLLGYKGFNDVSWRESKILDVQQGPAVIRSTVPLLRESCLDHMYMGERENGKYVVYPRGGKEITVYCDFTTNGGGWTVIQRRHSGDTPFPVNVAAYDDGFGPLDGEFWLGNRKINRLGEGQMLAIVYQNKNAYTYDLYNNFHVGQDSSLVVSGRSGIMPEAIFGSEDVLPFLAPKDLASSSNCVSKSDGAWWFKESSCDGLNLNGERKGCNDKTMLGTEMLFRPRLPPNDIVIKVLSMTMTYQDGMDACTRDGQRLCTSMEMCRDGKTVTGGSVKDMFWVPIADYYNRWMNIGSLDESKICEISRGPAWGTDGSFAENKGKAYCCGRAKKLTKLNIGQAYTYDMASDKCKTIGKQICSFQQICPDGNPVYGVALGRDAWSPITDTYNEWVQVGDIYETCQVHTSVYGNVPGWGITTDDHYFKGDVFCCHFEAEDPRFVVKYTVPNTYTYMDGMDECEKKGQRLCSKAEICPNGKTPQHGIMDVNMWARVLDMQNNWIYIGNVHSPCASTTFPVWGETSIAKDEKSVLLCCPLLYEGRITRTWKYDVKFQGNSSYIRFPKITPLQTSTVCWWMLLNVAFDQWKTVFSYRSLETNEQMVEFAVMTDGKFQLTIGGDKRESQFPPLFLDNHEYHHVCVLWNTVAGAAKVYRDGMLVTSFPGFGVSQATISGSLTIGQSYTNTSSSFDPERSFRGVITRFNIWDYELDEDVINLQSLVCGEEEGSIIAWPEVKLWTFDGVEIIEGDDCFPENCLDYLYRNKNENDVYEVRPLKNQSTIRVYCNQSMGGWMGIGKRAGGLLNFHDRTYKEYRNGFGTVGGEFWLGHDKIYLLTSAQIQQSLLSGRDETKTFVALYQWFMVAREDKAYALHYFDPVGTNNELPSNKAFVTSDRDKSFNCGRDYGPYWHKNDASCLAKSNLFGDPLQGGPRGAQWFGKDAGKVSNWQWKIKHSHGFKERQPVIYWTDKDMSWTSGRLFCKSKGKDLCLAAVLCNENNIPFGASLAAFRRTPVRDGNGKWLNIGDQGRCNILNPVDGSNNNPFDYKKRVICCHGYPKRDWRYDLRFREGSDGHIKIESLANMYFFNICWWLRVPPFTQDIATVFTFIFNSVKIMQFSFTKDGTFVGKFDTSTESKSIPSAIDGDWHNFCLYKRRGYIDVMFDGELSFVLPLGAYPDHVIDGTQLIIGQDVSITGSISSGRGLVGEISRFNWWHGQFFSWEVRKMSEKCGNEMGNLVAWPEVKYSIVGDVEYISGTTCIKPVKHFWPFTEVDGVSYTDIMSNYDLATVPKEELVPGKVFTTDPHSFLQKVNLPDDCLSDPELCRRTGLTVGVWLKRKGLESNILPESDPHRVTLMKWLDVVTSGVSEWLLCYNNTGPDMDIAAFHSGCDYVGATVTVVESGGYVFGGFSNENWGGPVRYTASHSSFLFSIYNPSNIGPVKLEVISNQNASALYMNEWLGPTFGKNFDLKITSPESSSVLGQTYNLPPGFTAGTNAAESFFTSSEPFTVDRIEVFYAYVPSEAVGIEFPSVIKDDQITASYINTAPELGPQNARLHSTALWNNAQSDTSPWLQVKLNDVMMIKKIAIQGCSNQIHVKKFKLNFGMDGVHWSIYTEKMTEKIFTANTDGTTVVDNTLENAVETKYVRVIPVERNGYHACMRIELYAAVQQCPATSSLAVICSRALTPDGSVTQQICESVGCCFLDQLGCYSKQESITAVGMESKAIKDENIVASSFKGDKSPYTARFSAQFNGWMSGVQSVPQWLQVELNQDEILTHVATQANRPANSVSYCKFYTLHYRKASGVFAVYMENGQARIFEGYADQTRTIKNLFLKPFIARFVRIYPQRIPTEIVRIELYRALEGSGTSIFKTTYFGSDRPTGVTLRQQMLMQYRYAVQADSALWEVQWEWIGYHWTHLVFTWSERSGIQVYENGIFKLESRHPSEFSEVQFVPLSDKFIVAHNGIRDVPHVFEIANLFVLKRYVFPNEATPDVYDVSCNFGDMSQCIWNNTNWNMTDVPTPSNDTGPDAGFKIRDSHNLAWGKSATQSSTLTENGISYNASFAVDGFLDSTCAVAQPGAAWWSVDIGELRKIELVIVFQRPGYDLHKLVQYGVSVSAISPVSSPPGPDHKFCYEFKKGGDYKTGRFFHCNETEDVRTVLISNVDASMSLTLAEVAVYTMASDVFPYMEASYPVKKGFNGRLTTRYFSQYNCLHFVFHMHGTNMGRLNVFGPGSEDGNQTLLWRLAGDQGNKWQSAVVRLENNNLDDFNEVSFEAVVGDGYRSDIALDNVVFTVDSQCSTRPPAAIPTVSAPPTCILTEGSHCCVFPFTYDSQQYDQCTSVDWPQPWCAVTSSNFDVDGLWGNCLSAKHNCLCLTTSTSDPENHLTITTCTTLSQGFQWLPNGVLQQQGKCLRPVTNDVIDGTNLVTSTSCNPNEVSFRLTPSGAIQHVSSLMCVQSADWKNGLKENDKLALGKHGCHDSKWSWTTILLKDGAGYHKLNVLKHGTGSISCGDYDGSLLRFIPADVQTTRPGALVITYNEPTSTYIPATVVEVHENESSLVVSTDETENIVVSTENTTKTPNQPIRGSSILGVQATPTRILSEWLGSRGVFSEFWRPCMYQDDEGTAEFNCSLEKDVPTLLLIRKERVLIGGFMDRVNSKPNRNFLFSIKESSSLKFDDVSSAGGASASLTESGMTFGDNNEELAITWNGELAVKNIPGSVFGITEVNSMAGEQQFTAADFEVLQPTDEICVPRCKSNELCDQITGKCICDSTHRPPSWCLIGASSETIYADADHYWPMDSRVNIIDENAENKAWALVEGKLKRNIGVNGRSVEIKNSEANIELVSNHQYFKAPFFLGEGLTISFWFKSIETEQSSIAGRMFFRTSDDLDDHTGMFLYQGNTRGEIIYRTQQKSSHCVKTFHIEPNLWTFVAIVRVQSGWKTFLNGVVIKVRAKCDSNRAQTNPRGRLIFGNGGNDCSALFDDVAVWYRALDDNEVLTIYRYYYKDPPLLTASLEMKFTTLVWDDELLDKESDGWRTLQNEVHSKFGSLFPGHENTSFAIEECRDESALVCNIGLYLNGSDYEVVEILEDQDILQNAEISNLKTDKVHNATIFEATSPEASKIILEWKLNPSNLYQGFIVMYVNNKTNETFNVTENKFEPHYELQNLTGYSHYFVKLAVYTLAGVGKWSEVIVETEEDVPKHPPTNLKGENVSSTELSLKWDGAIEENTYKEIRGYVVYVIDASTSVVVKNISTNASTLEVVIDDLRKFRTYSLYIGAYTVDVGIQSMVVNLTTSEDAPDAPPDDVQVFNSSSTSLRIEFDPVSPDLINGILRGYRVFYFKSREGNHTRRNFTITKEPGSNVVTYRRRRRSVGQYHEGYPLFADIYNLEEYTNYTVQIQAITIEDGPLASPFTTLTGEDLPSMSPPNVTARNSSSTSILLEWDLMPEDDRNGILLGYMVYYKGFHDGVDHEFVHESTSLSLDLQGLEKFTEYSFELTAFNSYGESNRSEVVYCKTDQDRPDLPPQDIVGTPTSPTTMGIMWKPVPFPFGRGIILGYKFVFSTMSGEVMVSRTLPPDEDFISVSDLQLFTNYTVNMTAFTIKGNGPWSSKVVLSLQIAPTIPPLNLTAGSFTSLNSIPVYWQKVPPELTLGYIVGYRLYIKLITVGLEDVPDTPAKEVVLKGAPTSYVFEGLDFFSKYMIYLVAYTVGGDSPRSNTIYAETCRCGPTLFTQWTNLAPYTNITNPEYYDNKILKNDWGIFPYIVNDAVSFCCQTCKTHNYSSVSFTHNIHGQSSEVFGNGALIKSIDGLTDLTFPVYGYMEQAMYHQVYKYTPLIESPGSAFIVRKDDTNMSGLLMDNILGNWPLAIMMLCLAFAAGAVMWWLEKSGNSEEFSPSVLKGIWNGFWWAYVTMTTVGYGDRSPRTIFGRIFAIVWTLVGLVITGIMVGDLASSLTISVSNVEKIIYGAKVGALELSPEFRLGVRLNAKMNTARPYNTLDELYKALLHGEVDGILLDAYVVGSRADLFKNPRIVVNKIKDYRTAYGIVWAGRSSRMKVCLDWYMKKTKSKMFTHIAENIIMARKIDQKDVSAEMANLFDPTTKLFTKTLFLSLVSLAAVFVLGLIYEVIRRRRLATKVKPQGLDENEMKNKRVETIDGFQKLVTDIVHRAKATKVRHIQQLRAFREKSWIKKAKVRPINVPEARSTTNILEDIE